MLEKGRDRVNMNGDRKRERYNRLRKKNRVICK